MNTLSDWNLVKTFLALADQLHRADAAQQLGVSARTVRRRIHQLEDEPGVPLVTRTRQRTPLNPAGRWLRDTLARPLTQANDALLDAHRHTTPPLTIAISAELPNHWTRQISDWIHTADQTTRLQQRTPDEALDLLRTGDIDLALLAHEPPDQRSQIVGDEPLVVVFPENHPAAGQATIHPGDLIDLPVAVSEHASDDWQHLAQRLHGDAPVHQIIAPRLATIGQGLIHTARIHDAATLTLAATTGQSDTTGLAVRPLHPPLTIPVTLAASTDVPDKVFASLAEHLIDVPRLPPTTS